MTEPWALLVQQGAQALLEGRFGECERLAGQAARLAPGEPSAGLLAVAACREQGRASEAEVLVRRLLAEHPGTDEGQALLGAVLVDLGRDGEARRQLDQLDCLDDGGSPPAVIVLAAEIAAALESPAHAQALHGPLLRHAGAFAGCHGSVARHLGLMCHVLGHWDEAEQHFRAALGENGGAGAPVLVAHTRRHYSALLRARGRDGDWEQAIDLLAEAAGIYRTLEIERLAEEAEAVLRRAQMLAPVDQAPAGASVFRRTAAGWDLAFGGQQAVVPDIAGLGHIAALLAAEGRPVHVIDLVEAVPGDRVVVELQSRLAEIDAQLVAGEREPVAAALARAERDFLRAELAVLAAGQSPAGEVGDRARRLVALRVRTSLDRIDNVLPALARHLRRGVRTGTFCLYEPERPEGWKLGP